MRDPFDLTDLIVRLLYPVIVAFAVWAALADLGTAVDFLPVYLLTWAAMQVFGGRAGW